MLSAYFIISCSVAFLFVLLGVIALLRNASSVLNRLFLLANTSLAFWLVSNYLAGSLRIEPQFALIANRLVFGFGMLSTLAIYFFLKKLTFSKTNHFDRILLILNLICVAASFGPYIVTGVIKEEATYAITFGFMSSVYFVVLLATAVQLARHLIVTRKKSAGSLKEQLYAIEVSFIIGLAGIFITNAVLPFAFGIFSVTTVGALFSSLFVFGLSYAIIKHRLFDIRLVVARSAAYFLLAGTIVAVYSLTVYFISSRIFEPGSMGRDVVPIVLAVILSLIGSELKKRFDSLTNTLFYRDSYDPQLFLDGLNKTLVETIELEKLLKKCSEVIKTNLKATYCNFLIFDTAYAKNRTIGDGPHNYNEQFIKSVNTILQNEKSRVIYAESFVQTSLADQELSSILKAQEIELLLRIGEGTGSDVGYMFLGVRKSGSLYSQQDIRFLEIIANELVIALQNALRYEEIEQFSMTLQKKVNDATRELRRSNEKLKALDEAKDEFISMASHQLRTPLTSVKGYLSMLAEGDAGKLNDTQKQFVNQAFISSQRMVYLIADLLNVSRLKTGKFVIEAAPTYLPDVIESEIAQLYETVKSRGLTMLFDKPSSFSTLLLDETKIRQVIMNFTDNAIYYTPSGGLIVLELKETDKTVEFTVKDNGLGVPKADQPHLFTKFYRAGNARKARPDGTGLGLFMAKKVIVAQGGSLVFKSTEGKGSIFGFAFPKEKLLVK